MLKYLIKIVFHFFKYFQMDVTLNSFILKLKVNTCLNFQAVSVYFIKFQDTFVINRFFPYI